MNSLCFYRHKYRTSDFIDLIAEWCDTSLTILVPIRGLDILLPKLCNWAEVDISSNDFGGARK